jgi:hypothetical protein
MKSANSQLEVQVGWSRHYGRICNAAGAGFTLALLLFRILDPLILSAQPMHALARCGEFGFGAVLVSVMAACARNRS